MKYIDAEKLRNRIAQRIEELARDKYIDSHDAMCRTRELNIVLSFIDTLSKEKSEIPNDLEEVAENYLQEVKATFLRTMEHPTAKDAFIAGAEWQKATMMEDAYEEEVQELYQDEDGIHCVVSVGTDYKPGTIVYSITIPKEDKK